MKPNSPTLPVYLHRQLARLRAVGRSEIVALVAALVVVLCIYGFIELADEVREGEFQTVDEWLLLSLRRGDDPGIPIGPDWLREAALDITALGSHVVLILMVLAVVGLMWFQGNYAAIPLTVLATATGALVAGILKYLFARDRPTVVPHLREVTSSSFPSGHAMLATVVYLTLGILLMQVVKGRTAKLYCLCWAMLLAFLVGISRIYLGVHYATDVLGGWLAGLSWALTCWLVVQNFRKSRQVPSG